MENNQVQYIKPNYKILGRFVSECLKFIRTGQDISLAIKDFKAYFHYNRELVPPYLSSKPWIAHRAYLDLESKIRPDMQVLEFGSGGSTLYLADKVASIYSIEHDEKWFTEIHAKLKAYPKVTHILVKPEKKQGKPEYASINGLFSQGLDFEKYAHAADHLPNDSIDLLIIDGRVRPQCLINTVGKLKKGGILIFDNAERESYQNILQQVLSGWKVNRYAGVSVYDAFFSTTDIYVKPDH
ncbi:O-methyltransferase [Algoriphagus litoralis]|uniref:hypothetical protein n=1 Tax=Algoriphagus litoralis TaxID=2202829 RepID=UPI000DBA47C8|nr:hypothetical protein [Algoriphagus litoralis]